jgi:hypothetical protein
MMDAGLVIGAGVAGGVPPFTVVRRERFVSWDVAPAALKIVRLHLFES